MSYDPFSGPQARRQHSYNDSTEYNPYMNPQPLPHPSYDPPYQDEVPHATETMPPEPLARDKEFDPFQPPPK